MLRKLLGTGQAGQAFYLTGLGLFLAWVVLRLAIGLSSEYVMVLGASSLAWLALSILVNTRAAYKDKVLAEKIEAETERRERDGG